MSERDLILELRALAADIDLPPTIDLVPAVRRGIAQLPDTGRRTTLWDLARPALRPALITAAAVLGAIAVLLTASPEAREVVRDWLGVGGIDIEVRPSESGGPDGALGNPPGNPTEGQGPLTGRDPLTGESTGPGTVGDPLPLSIKTSLSAARQAVGFTPRVPEQLGDPDRVYIDDSYPGGVVTMVWAPSDVLPEIGTSDVGVLLSIFRSEVDADYLTKVVETFDDVAPAEVDGVDGIWFGGPPHLILRDANGFEDEATARLSAHSLIWEREGITHRLEANLPVDLMVSIGDSLP